MTLEIVHYGEEVLHQKGEPVTRFDGELKLLFEDMVETCTEAEGIGLASQQIGKALLFCVVDLRGAEIEFEYSLDGAQPPLDLVSPIGMCNPIVTVIDPATTTYEEGCLSFPEIQGDVDRPDLIRCEYQDTEGHPHVIECNGLLGRCIQHEVDHLNGVLFTERMKRKVFKKVQPAVNDLQAQTLARIGKS